MKVGRPPLPKGKRKSAFYHVRLNKAQGKLIRKAAKDRGCRTISEWIRMVLEDWMRELGHMKKVANGPKCIARPPKRAKPGYRILKGEEMHNALKEAGWRTRPLQFDHELAKKYAEKCGHWIQVQVKK